MGEGEDCRPDALLLVGAGLGADGSYLPGDWAEPVYPELLDVLPVGVTDLGGAGDWDLPWGWYEGGALLSLLVEKLFTCPPLYDLSGTL